ncbi:hypothetical protein I3F57_06230 [Lacticaseibacillus paracasei subsp. tolerans]|uniref:hypothetical protein n=1 Tax=Lacticaseibacillus paracasei TaxID=1597 RepID=UPI0018AD4A7E|nr:hypothetical protein [Lacticaseibacillus paracasei]QPI89339.1 hypothetical protein I3F57_06230 [Lacticaseibacillus paracasei subsp. tolerans]
MKIKVWLDDDKRLISWAFESDDTQLGTTEDGQQIIEAEDTSQFVEDHAALVDGKMVLDPDYHQPGPPKETPAEPTTAELKEQIDMMQAAVLELADLSLGTKK